MRLEMQRLWCCGWNGKNLEMLLTGDVEGEGEVQLTEWMRAHGKTKCDILKAAHHGSKNSTLPEFFTAADTEICMDFIGNRQPVRTSGKGDCRETQ